MEVVRLEAALEDVSALVERAIEQLTGASSIVLTLDTPLVEAGIDSIGLNLQAVHHIFPNIHWAHYPALYPIVCEVLGEPQVASKSYAQTFKEHVHFLGKMNELDDGSIACPKGSRPKAA